MQLDLTRYRQPLSHVRPDVPAGGRRRRRATRTGSWRRSSWTSRSTRTRTGSGWSGTVRDRARAAVQPVPRAVPAAGGCAVRPAVSAGVGGLDGRRTRSRRRGSGDQLLPGRPDRPERAAARAVLPGAADEAAVPGRLPGAVPAVRHEPEHRHLRLRAGVGRSRGSRRSRDSARPRIVESTCLIQNADTPRPAPPSGARTTRSRAADDRPLPAVPRAEGAAPHLPALRLLQAAAGPAGRRRIGSLSMIRIAVTIASRHDSHRR